MLYLTCIIPRLFSSSAWRSRLVFPLMFTFGSFVEVAYSCLSRWFRFKGTFKRLCLWFYLVSSWTFDNLERVWHFNKCLKLYCPKWFTTSYSTICGPTRPSFSEKSVWMNLNLVGFLRKYKHFIKYTIRFLSTLLWMRKNYRKILTNDSTRTRQIKHLPRFWALCEQLSQNTWPQGRHAKLGCRV